MGGDCSPTSFSVGGGSAGCVLANRLSADPAVKVLLLEAGGLPTAATEVPIMALLHMHGTLDWDYKTDPQEHACKAHQEMVRDPICWRLPDLVDPRMRLVVVADT